VAESRDGGQRWTLLAGGWLMVGTGCDALTVAPGGGIWFGGQNGLEQPVLARRAANGLLSEWQGLMPNPGTVKNLRLLPEAPQRAMVCGAGAIVQTRDP
jgi:hypothetical protein